MIGYYKKTTGEIYEIGYQEEIHLSGRNIIELTLNNNCNFLYCMNNKIKTLTLKKCIACNCSDNNIHELIYEQCDGLACQHNKLKELYIKRAIYVSCDMKSLTKIDKIDILELYI